MIVFYLALALALLSLERSVAKDNYGSWCNGYGAIEATLSKKGEHAKAPMVYRVLIPWLVGLTKRIWFGYTKLSHYLFWKWVLMAGALIAAHYILGPVVALVLALIWILTFQFDYWSLYGEALCFVLVLSGSFPLAFIGIIIGVMSKETCLLAPFVYLLVTNDPIGFVAVFVAAAITHFFVRAEQGVHGHYYKYIVVLQNLDINETWKQPHRRPYLLLGWALFVISIAMVWMPMAEPFYSTRWVPAVIWLLGFFGAFVHEPRVFAVSAIWIGAWLAK